jgi:hypothetical protein
MSKVQCIAQDSTIKSTKQRTIIMDKIENSFPTRIENILFNVECLVLKGGGKCRRRRYIFICANDVQDYKEKMLRVKFLMIIQGVSAKTFEEPNISVICQRIFYEI